MPPLVDIRKIREQALFDKYGLMDTGKDASGLPNFGNPHLGQLSAIADEPGKQVEKEPSIEDMIGTFDHTAQDKYSRILSDRPTREGPSLMRAIVAAGMGLGSKDPFKTEEEVMYAPYNRKKADWDAQIDPAYKSAQLENTANANDRLARVSTINARVAADKLIAHERETQANIASREKIASDKLDLEKEKANGAKFNFDGEYVIVTRPDGTAYNSGVLTTAFNPMERARLQAQTAITTTGMRDTSAENIAAQNNASREGIAGDKLPQVFNMPDPDDPTKMIAATINPATGKAERVVLDGKGVGPAQRPTGAGTGRQSTVQPVNIKDIQSKAQETINVLNELADEKTGKYTEIGDASIGGPAVVGATRIPLTKAYAGAKALARLKSMLVIELIGEMKNQSRTGATGFGQLSRAELAVLEQSAGKLDPMQDKATFMAELNRIREKLKKILLAEDGTTPTVTQPRSALDISIDEALKGGKK